MPRPGYVYLMANRVNGTTYLGVTSNLIQRTYQHRNRLIDGFTSAHDCVHLVWYEAHEDLQEARTREWQMKKWRREWKVNTIEADNPDWVDLYPSLFG